MEQPRGRPADAFRDGIAANPLPRGIEEDPPPLRIGLEDDVVDMVEDRLGKIARRDQSLADRIAPRDRRRDGQADDEIRRQKRLERDDLVAQVATNQHDRAIAQRRRDRCHDRDQRDRRRRARDAAAEGGDDDERAGQEEKGIACLRKDEDRAQRRLADQYGPFDDLRAVGHPACAPCIDRDDDQRRADQQPQPVGEQPCKPDTRIERRPDMRQRDRRDQPRHRRGNDAHRHQAQQRRQRGDVGGVAMAAADDRDDHDRLRATRQRHRRRLGNSDPAHDFDADIGQEAGEDAGKMIAHRHPHQHAHQQRAGQPEQRNMVCCTGEHESRPRHRGIDQRNRDDADEAARRWRRPGKRCHGRSVRR